MFIYFYFALFQSMQIAMNEWSLNYQNTKARFNNTFLYLNQSYFSGISCMNERKWFSLYKNTQKNLHIFNILPVLFSYKGLSYFPQLILSKYHLLTLFLDDEEKTDLDLSRGRLLCQQLGLLLLLTTQDNKALKPPCLLSWEKRRRVSWFMHYRNQLQLNCTNQCLGIFSHSF